MLTRQQVIDTFVAGINEIPADELIEVYTAGFTQEQLDAVIARNIAARNDPTYHQRIANDYQNYITSTEEKQKVWTHVEPNSAP